MREFLQERNCRRYLKRRIVKREIAREELSREKMQERICERGSVREDL